MANPQWKSVSISLPFIIRYLQHDIHCYIYCKQSKQQAHNSQWITVNNIENKYYNTPTIHMHKRNPALNTLTLAQLVRNTKIQVIFSCHKTKYDCCTTVLYWSCDAVLRLHTFCWSPSAQLYSVFLLAL